MRRLEFFALAVFAAGCSAEPEPQTETLASVGIVDYGEPEGVDFIFGLTRIDQRFRLNPDAVPDFDVLFEAFQSSSDTGRSMRVIFDVASGRFDRDDTVPSYRVHRVEYDGAAFDVWRGYRKRVDDPPAAESSLARGVAYYSSGSPDRAVPALEEAPDETGDRQLLRALDDFRQWSALEPENLEAQLAVGLALRGLGAYDEAIEIFSKLIPAWPEERVRLVTRIGSTYRIMEDFPRALATLDRRADKLNNEFFADIPPTPAIEHDRAWALSVGAALEAAIASGSNAPNSAPCEGYWSYGEKRRERSRFLPVYKSGEARAVNAI